MISRIYLFVLLLTSFFGNAQDLFYVRCVDADNLERIEKFSVKSLSKKIQIKEEGNGVVQLINFQKGTEITVEAENCKAENYLRPDKRLEIAMNHNGERIVQPGDTIVIELLPNSEIINKRWEMEDQLYPDVDTINVESAPDEKPSFNNELEFLKVLSTKLHFPRHLVSENVSGTVYISAIVEKDGTLSNIKVQRNLDPHLDRIALRAVRNDQLPKLIPATKNNETVRSKIVIPLSFKLD